jgi:hypothetical protein
MPDGTLVCTADEEAALSKEQHRDARDDNSCELNAYAEQMMSNRQTDLQS